MTSYVKFHYVKSLTKLKGWGEGQGPSPLAPPAPAPGCPARGICADEPLHRDGGQPGLQASPQPGSGVTTEGSLGMRTSPQSPVPTRGHSDSVGPESAQGSAANKTLQPGNVMCRAGQRVR